MQLVSATNVTALNLPAHGACADGEKLEYVIKQAPSGTAAVIPFNNSIPVLGTPFTAQSGDVARYEQNVVCVQIGATLSATVPSEWHAKLHYEAALSTWWIDTCGGTPITQSNWSGNEASVPADTVSFIASGEMTDHAPFTSEANAWSMLTIDNCYPKDLWVYLTTAPDGTHKPEACFDINGSNVRCMNWGTECAANSNFCEKAGYLDSIGSISGGSGFIGASALDVEVINPAGGNATGIVYAGFSLQCYGTVN